MTDQSTQEGQIKEIIKGRNLVVLIFLVSVLALVSYLLVSEIVWRLNDMKSLSFAEFIMVDSFYGAAGESVSGTTNISAFALRKIAALSLDLSILREKKFIDLLRYGDLPIVVGERGRINPFEPY